MLESVKKVLDLARSEIGYCEKATGSNLDSKTGNAGKNNYTKYGRDLRDWTNSGDTYGINYQWCDQFVDWLIVKCFGAEKAKKMIGGWSAYTPTSSDFYKKNNRWISGGSVPEAGDQIFFKNSQRIHHTGIVEKVDGGTVYTIEGNTAAGKTVEADGGEVARKSYSVKNTSIAGYGRPAWEFAEEEQEDTTAVGWHDDTAGRWYRHTAGTGPDTYYHEGVFSIEGKCYCFNEAGYVVKKNKNLINMDPETGALSFKR